MRFFVFFSVLVCALSLTACGDDGGSTPGTDAATVLRYHGCTTFIDRSTPGDTRTVEFGGAVGLAYAPKCLRIRAGQTVTFNGAFSDHPLSRGVAPSRATSNPAAPANNPIVGTAGGTTAAFTFPDAGLFPYYCEAHQDMGMFGVVEVIP